MFVILTSFIDCSQPNVQNWGVPGQNQRFFSLSSWPWSTVQNGQRNEGIQSFSQQNEWNSNANNDMMMNNQQQNMLQGPMGMEKSDNDLNDQTVHVRVVVDDFFKAYFNGEELEKSNRESFKSSQFILEHVKEGDVFAIEGVDKSRIAGILAEFKYLDGPNKGLEHYEAKGWLCTKHKPKDDTWKQRGFKNGEPNYGWKRSMEPAYKHGTRKDSKWSAGKGDLSWCNEKAQWFWTKFNRLENHVWCRIELQ
jgi:hypothetical protein